MKKLLFHSLSVFLSLQSFGALPPYWDSLRQIQTVLDSLELGKVVHGAIESIVAEKNLSYTVKTSQCQARVWLKAETPKHPGPISYSVCKVSDVICDEE
jgi:hypothetical protein